MESACTHSSSDLANHVNEIIRSVNAGLSPPRVASGGCRQHDRSWDERFLSVQARGRASKPASWVLFMRRRNRAESNKLLADKKRTNGTSAPKREREGAINLSQSPRKPITSGSIDYECCRNYLACWKIEAMVACHNARARAGGICTKTTATLFQ